MPCRPLLLQDAASCFCKTKEHFFTPVVISGMHVKKLFAAGMFVKKNTCPKTIR